MEDKKIKVSLGKAVLIILIATLIIGGILYYFVKNISSTSNSTNNTNTVSQENTEYLLEINTIEDTSPSVSNTNEDTNSVNTDNQNSIHESSKSITNNTQDTSSNTKKASVSQDYSQYVGVWQSDLVLDSGIPEEELIINKIGDTSINFDYLKYKIDSFQNVVANLSDNVAKFETRNDTNSCKIKGTITFSDNTIILNITSSTSDIVKTGTFTFKTQTQKSILK